MKIFAATSMYETAPNNPKTGFSRAAPTRRAKNKSMPTIIMRPNEQGVLVVVGKGPVSNREAIMVARAEFNADKRFTRA